jgi:RecB family endonuclease NucS
MSLQTLIERHLESLLGVRFPASEHSTGKTHRGRIDTLGIDENNRPVIPEYKRALNQNVINQGLYYLNWLSVTTSPPTPVNRYRSRRLARDPALSERGQGQ